MIRRRGSAVAVFLLTLAVLAGCGGGGGGDDDNEPDGDAGPSPTAETTAPEEPYLPVPEGVELTEPGTELTVGDPAMIAWQPRQNLIGVLDVAVIRIEKTTFAESFEGWDVKQEQKQKLTPYFVHVTVANRGDTNLSGRLVPLYAEDSSNTLLEPTEFKDGTFKPCPGGILPKRFTTNQTTEVCMVYLLGDGLNLTSITFRPTSTFDPITWTGKIQRIEKPGKKKQKQGNSG